jgi:hypothetical protein
VTTSVQGTTFTSIESTSTLETVTTRKIPVLTCSSGTQTCTSKCNLTAKATGFSKERKKERKKRRKKHVWWCKIYLSHRCLDFGSVSHITDTISLDTKYFYQVCGYVITGLDQYKASTQSLNSLGACFAACGNDKACNLYNYNAQTTVCTLYNNVVMQILDSSPDQVQAFGYVFSIC